jgi:hypothetical protein
MLQLCTETKKHDHSSTADLLLGPRADQLHLTVLVDRCLANLSQLLLAERLQLLWFDLQKHKSVFQ